MSIGENKGKVIGDFGDVVNVPYVPSTESIMAYLATGYFHVHGASFVLPKYANPVTLTSAAASWATTGTITVVIPINTVTKPFDLHWISINATSADLFGIIDIFASTNGVDFTLIGAVDVYRGSVQARDYPMPVQIPQQPANTGIYCRFSDSTASARTCAVKFYGHVYGTTL